jgi:hypothetical protein
MGSITAGVAAAGTALSAGSAISGAIGSRKAQKNQQQAFSAAEEAGAFDPLVLAKPERMNVPGAGQIMGSYRGDIQQNYGQYEDIAQRYSASEQAATRAATEAANPNYYNVLQQLSNTALQAGRGVLPEDVKQQILQNANEDAYLKGFSYGKTGGGGNVYAGGNDAAAGQSSNRMALESLTALGSMYGNLYPNGMPASTTGSSGGLGGLFGGIKNLFGGANRSEAATSRAIL